MKRFATTCLALSQFMLTSESAKSKTCMEGKVTDQTGKDLADFKNCSVGTWWGGS